MMCCIFASRFRWLRVVCSMWRRCGSAVWSILFALLSSILPRVVCAPSTEVVASEACSWPVAAETRAQQRSSGASPFAAARQSLCQRRECTTTHRAAVRGGMHTAATETGSSSAAQQHASRAPAAGRALMCCVPVLCCAVAPLPVLRASIESILPIQRSVQRGS